MRYLSKQITLRRIVILTFGFLVTFMLFFFISTNFRNKVCGNYYYYSSIGKLPIFKLEYELEELAAFDGQIEELLKIPRDVPYTGEKHNVPTKLSYENKGYEVLSRPVGMYNDHWKEKPSIKILVQKDETINGLSEFSLLRPVTRSFLGDWFAGEVENRQQLLHLEREFVAVKKNKGERKVFLLEETFKGISNRLKNQGVVFKYSIKNENCAISAYTENTSTKTKLLIESKINLFLKDSSTYDEVFDSEKMGMYYAITDLVQGFHQLVEFNTHFFYNTKTSKIEPIGREWNSQNYIKNEIIMMIEYVQLEDKNSLFHASLIHEKLFSNSSFVDVYLNQCSILSNLDLEKMLEESEGKINLYSRVLWKDMGTPLYDFSYVHESMSYMKRHLKSVNKLGSKK